MAITLAHAGQTTIDFLGTTYSINWGEGGGAPNLGARQSTWEELPSYAGGANAQVNVQRGYLIPVTIPTVVKGSSVANLKTNLDTLWATVLACSSSSPGTLTWETESYNIVTSSLPSEVMRDPLYQLSFRARFVLTLMREP